MGLGRVGGQNPPSATLCWVWPNINCIKKAFSSALGSPWGLKVMPWGKGGCLVGRAALAAWRSRARTSLAGC